VPSIKGEGDRENKNSQVIWIDDAQEKPPRFLGVDRDGAAIYLHSANMETKGQ
jgi:hypothetical protein